MDAEARAKAEGLLQYISDRFASAVMALPHELHTMSDTQLRLKAQLTSVDYAVRVAVWREYEIMHANKMPKIVTRDIINGICSDYYFHDVLLRDKYKLAWVIRPLQAYKKECESLLARGVERLWEIMELPIEAKGKLDVKAADIILRAIKMLEERVEGMAVQRRAQLNLNVAGDPKAARQAANPFAMRDLDAQIASMESEIHGGAATGAGHKALPAQSPYIHRVAVQPPEFMVIEVGEEAPNEEVALERPASDDPEAPV